MSSVWEPGGRPRDLEEQVMRRRREGRPVGGRGWSGVCRAQSDQEGRVMRPTKGHLEGLHVPNGETRAGCVCDRFHFAGLSLRPQIVFFR